MTAFDKLPLNPTEKYHYFYLWATHAQSEKGTNTLYRVGRPSQISVPWSPIVPDSINWAYHGEFFKKSPPSEFLLVAIWFIITVETEQRNPYWHVFLKRPSWLFSIPYSYVCGFCLHESHFVPIPFIRREHSDIATTEQILVVHTLGYCIRTTLKNILILFVVTLCIH